MRKLLVALAILGLVALPSPSLAQSYGLDTTASGALCDGGTTCVGTAENSSIAYFIGTKIINPALGIIGVLFLCLTIYAGFLWMAARGNAKQVQTAKDVLIAAVIGIAVISSAYAITRTLFNGIGTIGTTEVENTEDDEIDFELDDTSGYDTELEEDTTDWSSFF